MKKVILLAALAASASLLAQQPCYNCNGPLVTVPCSTTTTSSASAYSAVDVYRVIDRSNYHNAQIEASTAWMWREHEKAMKRIRGDK